MKRRLIIIGRPREGKENMTSLLVKTMVNANAASPGITPFLRLDGAPFPEDMEPDSIVAYFSSKGRFPSVLEECRKRRSTLIVASSDVKAGEDVPLDVDIPVIIAENLSPLVMGVFGACSCLGKVSQMIGAHAYVAEGHQKAKTSAPATAQKIAGYFGNPPESVGSIRSDSIAAAVLGIPEVNLGGFGAHFVVVSHNGTNVRISFDTKGRAMYYDGLMLLWRKIEEMGLNLTWGVHEAHALLF
jgi:dihydrodipicolinate reductase